ncbi:MAG: hypothetical protein QM758_30170 [Armatimonas sp.]
MPKFLHVALAFLVGVSAIFAAVKPAQAQVEALGKNAVVSAKVTSVETNLGGNGWHYLATTVHLQNLTKKPLILGVNSSKVSSTDDRGNTYGVILVRGIGQVAGTMVDTKFTLPAEGGGDALIQMRWRGERNTIFGTVFDLKMPVQVIVPLEANQYKLGVEHLLTFTGLKAGLAVPLIPTNTVNAGPFTMQITRMTPSITGNRRLQTVTLAARIKNTSDKPLILAYEGTSSFGIDDQGNPFAYGTAGTHDTSISGIGMVAGNSADPQFELAPGEARDVQFTILRRLGRETMGTQLTYYVALAQLEVLPSKQVRTLRQYSLTFPRMAGLNP